MPPRLHRLLPLIFYAVLAGGAALIYQDYGGGWDDAVQNHYGYLSERFLVSFGRDDRAVDFLNLRRYGALPELFVRLGSRGAALDYGLRAFLCALLTLSAVPAVMFMARRMSSHAAAPLLAGLSLVLMPRFLGHAFINSKDGPFAAAVAWSMVATTCLLGRRRLAWRDFLAAGLAAGLALAARPGGLPLIAALQGSCLMMAAALWRGRLVRRGLRDLMPKAGAALLLAWVVMVCAWPYGLQRPLVAPFEAAAEAAAFPLPDAAQIPFLGRLHSVNHLPAYYMATMVGVTTPLTALLPAIFAIGRAAWAALGRRLIKRHLYAYGVVTAWLVLPLLALAVRRSPVYGGLRHFLFILPALAALAGCGLAALLHTLRPRYRPWQLWVLTACVLSKPLMAVVRLHPYEQTYFNELVGGLRGAARRFETDYWGTSYKEAIDHVNARAADSSAPVKLLIAGDKTSFARTQPYLGPGVQAGYLWPMDPRTPGLEQFDYLVVTSWLDGDRRFARYPTVYTVSRDGAVLCVVKKLR